MASFNHDPSTTHAAPITGLVPMVHVADVNRSAAFYMLLGFAIGHSAGEGARMGWAWMYAPAARDWKRGPNLMLNRSDGPIDPEAQGVLLYLYAADMVAVRRSLLANGVEVGEIDYPDYLPNGEFRVRDPDGYTLMIAQAAANTP